MLLYKFRCALDFQEISFGQWACVSPQKPPRSTVFAAEQRTRQIQRSTSNKKTQNWFLGDQQSPAREDCAFRKKWIFPYLAEWPQEAVTAEWNSRMFGNGAANRHRKALYIFLTVYSQSVRISLETNNELVLEQIDMGYTTLEATMPGQNRRVDRAKQAPARFPTWVDRR